jgi:hypothetical protein
MASASSELARVRYWQGQLLGSGDLQTQVQSDQELRRLHDLVVHRAFGIAIGLTATLADGALTLGCGMAYDCTGRALVVERDRTLPLPSSADRGSLARSPDNTVVRADSGAAISDAGRHRWTIDTGRVLLDGAPAGVTLNVSAIALVKGTIWQRNTAGQWFAWTGTGWREGRAPLTLARTPSGEALTLILTADCGSADGIALRWKPARDVRPTTEIAVARLLPGAASPELDPDFHPLIARPMARPRLSTGTTIPGNTPWKTWKTGESELGVQVRIDTSAAGYTVTPHYIAEAIAEQPTPDFYPAWLTSIADPSPDGFTLRLLLRRITRESLEIVDSRAEVDHIPKPDRTISVLAGNPLRFRDLVTRVLPLAEQFYQITAIRTGVATVPLPDFQGTKAVAFGNLPRSAKVTATPVANSNEVKVDDVSPFLKNVDLVAKMQNGAVVSKPVVVDDIRIATKSLILHEPIEGLAVGDQIAAADFRTRATVLGIAGKVVTLYQASGFAIDSYVCVIGEDLTPGPAFKVIDVSSGTITLEQEIPDLAQSDVIASCAFPTIAAVDSILSGDRCVIRGSNPLHPGDVVAAHDRMALVAEVTGSTIRLATPIPGLAEDDNLQVATVRGVTDISFQSSGKVTVTKEVRRTDFLADVTGWRMAGAGPGATAFVLKSSDTSISLTSMLDGVLPADKIGLADVATGFFLLRLKEKPDVVAGDGVQLSGLDRLRGEVRSFTGSIYPIPQDPNLVLIALAPAPSAPFNLRPEDISASILFLRGSALALIQKLDLYVSWLACADPDPMPRPCSGVEAPDCPCVPLKE